MKSSELAKLGMDTDGFAPDLDYVPNVLTSDEGVQVELVHRAFLQLEQLNALGGVNVLGGQADRRDNIKAAMEDGVDLLTAVWRFGDAAQVLRARELMATGKVSD